MKFFTKDERNTVFFLTIAFMVGVSILYVRDNNRNTELKFIEINEEIADIVKSDNALSEKINLNIAGKDELISLPGIGPVTAEKIIAKRLEMCSFSSIEDLLLVPGIGVKTIEKLKILLNYKWEIENCIHKIY